MQQQENTLNSVTSVLEEQELATQNQFTETNWKALKERIEKEACNYNYPGGWCFLQIEKEEAAYCYAINPPSWIKVSKKNAQARKTLCDLLGGICYSRWWPAYFDTKEELLEYIRMCHELDIVG